MDIRQTYGLREVRLGDVGIELEMEYRTLDLPALDDWDEFGQHWNRNRDGSLRGTNCEYVTRGPKPIYDVSQILHILRPLLSEKALPRVSPRAATHVHVNCQSLTMQQVLVICTAWWWCEQLMVQYFDPTREGNLFCLGIRHASHAPYHFARRRATGHGPDPHHDIFMNSRYAALNLASLAKFGSLEFRCMPSTTNVDAIDKWTHMCYNVCKVHEQYKDASDFMDAVFHKGVKDILGSIFQIGQVVDELVSLPNYERKLQENVPLLVNYAYGGQVFKGRKVEREEFPEEEGPLDDFVFDELMGQIREHDDHEEEDIDPDD